MEHTKPKAERTHRIARVVAILAISAVLCALVGLAGGALPPTPYPQIIGQNCGLVTSGLNRVSNDPGQGEQCLWNAYTACQTATLVFIEHGVDTGDEHVITVQPKGGSCTLTDAEQGYNANIHTSSRIVTYRCTSLQQQRTDPQQQQGVGLLLSGCDGEGDVYMPPRRPELVGHVCGTIVNFQDPVTLHQNVTAGQSAEVGSTQATVAGIEDCFWQAYAGGCTHPATLIYVTDKVTDQIPTFLYPEVEISHTVAVQASKGACVLTDFVHSTSPTDKTYVCTGMIRIVDGSLVVRGCGAEGDLPLPPATPPAH